jgi:hypothetical protein
MIQIGRKKMKIRTCLFIILILAGVSSFALQFPQDWDKVNASRTLPGNPGGNAALGRNVLYSISPQAPEDFGPEKSKLTDDKIIADSEIVFRHNDSVGFYYAGYTISSHHGISLVMDLEKTVNLHSSVIRLLNPSTQMSWWRLPQRVTLAVSRDGKDFYRVKTWKKFSTYGREEPGVREDYYYVEEKDREFFYPLTFDLRGIGARYVALSIQGESFLFWADEWQVFEMPEADPLLAEDKRSATVYQPGNRYPIPMGKAAEEKLTPRDSVYFGPAKDEMVIPTNMPLPQYIDFTDYRNKETRSELEQLVIELPRDVQILPSSLMEAQSVTTELFDLKGLPYKRIQLEWPLKGSLMRNIATMWTFNRLLGPIFLNTSKEHQGEQAARFYAVGPDGPFSAVECPIRTISVPAVPKIDVFPVGLSWMSGFEKEAWPDFFENYTRLGFNNIRVSAGMVDLEKKQVKPQYEEFLQKAREHDLKLTMVDGGTNRLHRYEPESKCLNDKNPFLCPSYFGEGFDEIVKEIATAAEVLKPHNVWWNIEAYGYAFLREGCTRCEKGIEESGLEPLDYFATCGTRILTGLRGALDGDERLERVGLYDLWPTAGSRLEAHGMHDADTINTYGHASVYHETFLFEDCYPEGVNTAMPHLYCAGLVDVLHDLMARPGARLLDKKWSHINVLSTGTFGEYPSFKVEPVIYEQVLNEGGIDFYNLSNFDTPLDFYYFAKALSTLAPYQPLLDRGRCRLNWKGTNSRLYYTAFSDGQSALLMIGNYTSLEQEETRIHLPVEEVASLVDLLDEEAQLEPKYHTLSISVPPQGFRLLLVNGRQALDKGEQ